MTLLDYVHQTRGTDMKIFTNKAVTNSKGVKFAPAKADISEKGYFDRKDYAVYKLCANYAGHVRGGIAYTWRQVAKDLSLDECKALLAKRARA